MSHATNEQQTSLYLVRRAEALLGAIKFFQGTLEHRLQFLAQSDFWEWEIDNLIYSFTSFAERSRTWETSGQAIEKLGTLGIAVTVRVIRRVRWSAGWNVNERRQRVVPGELLRDVIENWNALVDQAEASFVKPMQADAHRYGIRTVKDLHRLRRCVDAFGPHE